MAKNKNNKPKTNAKARMNKAVGTQAIDDQNINQNHNTRKEALGPNTNR